MKKSNRTFIVIPLLCVVAWSNLMIVTSAATVLRKEPSAEILGISLGMKKPKAQKRLEKIATFERNDRRRQEIWKLKDNRQYSHILLGYDADLRIRYVTAVADEQGERVRYSDVADIDQAKQDGEPKINNYNYVWEVKSRGKNRPHFIASARGRDPQYLSTYSIKKLD